MVVRVLLFGPEAAAAQCDAVVVEVPTGATGASVMAALGAAFPVLTSLLPAARLAVNSRFATADQVVQATDEVALIGLVSGG